MRSEDRPSLQERRLGNTGAVAPVQLAPCSTAAWHRDPLITTVTPLLIFHPLVLRGNTFLRLCLQSDRWSPHYEAAVLRCWTVGFAFQRTQLGNGTRLLFEASVSHHTATLFPTTGLITVRHIILGYLVKLLKHCLTKGDGSVPRRDHPVGHPLPTCTGYRVTCT
jgi:hypothetical protein